MDAHFFDFSDPVSSIGFLTTFKLVCDTNKIQKRVPIWILSFFAKNKLESTLCSRLSAATDIAPSVAPVLSAEPLRESLLLQSYPEVADYLFKTFANDQTVTGIDSAILLEIQTRNMLPMPYAYDLFAKSCKVAGDYDESTLNNIFIGGVDSSILHSLRKYWTSNPQVHLTNIFIKAQSLLAIRKEIAKSPPAGIQNATSKQFGKESWHNKTANFVVTESTTQPSRSFRRQSKFQQC